MEVTYTDVYIVLSFFENQRMWNDLHVDRNGSWIHRGLMWLSLYIVHDGLYIEHFVMDVHLVTVYIYCTQSK